jgi:hypothetical protein
VLRLVNSQRDPFIVKKIGSQVDPLIFFDCMDLKLILVFSWISSSLFHFHLWIPCWSFIFAWLYSYLASCFVFFKKKTNIFWWYLSFPYKYTIQNQRKFSISLYYEYSKSCHNSILTIFSNLFLQIKYIKE